jgi:hypothetical protein
MSSTESTQPYENPESIDAVEEHANGSMSKRGVIV